MSVSSGLFVATGNYNQIRALFQAYNDISQEKDQDKHSKQRKLWLSKIDALDLTIRRNDNVVVPTGWVQIFDYAAHMPRDDQLEIHAHISNLAKLT